MKRVLRVVTRISREVPAVATRHKVWAGIVIVLALLAVVIYVPRLPLVGPRSGREAESDFRGHLLQTLAGLVLAAGAYYTGRTFALNREGQITERFTRAVEQLADEKLDIRLGGIYALERIARDSETHHEPVMEVLTAFLREHSRWKGERDVSGGAIEPSADHATQSTFLPPVFRVDFQAVATILGRRDRRHERSDYRLDLTKVDLRRAVLPEADLEGATLYKANLGHAYMPGAFLKGAVLTDARLEQAYLFQANLQEARMEVAFLRRANLFGADLEGAHLSHAILREAILRETNLRRADLSGADLTAAIALTQEQAAEAFLDDETKLPEYDVREAGG